MNSKDSQLTTKFITKNQKYAIPDHPYSIPVSSTSDTFNSLVKSVLKEITLNQDEELIDETNKLNLDAIESVEFDFYINNELLSTSLEKFVHLNESIKTESVIEIEYVERYPPPEPIDTNVTEDWISSIRGLDDYILFGSYNNSVQIWNKNSKCLTQLPGHGGAVKTVCWIDYDKEKKVFTFLSGSQDQSLIQWEWSLDSNKVNKIEKCIGHTESVECVDVNPNKSKFVSGSWDKMLKLWNTGKCF